MALRLGFPTADGIRRLLLQPSDVVTRDDAVARRRPSEASAAHRALFDDYRADLRTAHDIAAPWWDATVEAQRSLGLSEEEALRAAYTARLAGPASHPKVVWIVRNYWLDCCDRNALCPAPQAVYPETFLLRWLIEEGEDDLVALVACMPYWPLGLDARGDWC